MVVDPSATVNSRRTAIECSVIACKYDNLWQNNTIFEKCTHYKPGVQRNPEVEFNKAISNAVETLDNVPTTGFSVVPPHLPTSGTGELLTTNVNKINDASNGFGHNILINDPRGFTGGIAEGDFYRLLIATGGNLINWELPGKFVYAWAKNSDIPTLMSVDDLEYQTALDESKPHWIRSSSIPSDKNIEVGHVYRALKTLPKGDYLYLGKHSTYSVECHVDAVSNGEYSAGRFIEAEKNYLLGDIVHKPVPTTTNKMVFYRLDPRRGNRKFFIRTSCNLVFSTDVTHEYPDIATLIDNVRSTMTSSLAFNKIDLSRIKAAKMDYTTFKDVVMAGDAFVERLYPFNTKDVVGMHTPKCMTTAGKGLSYTCYEIRPSTQYRIAHSFNYDDPTSTAEWAIWKYRHVIYCMPDAYKYMRYDNIESEYSGLNCTLQTVFEKMKPITLDLFSDAGCAISPLNCYALQIALAASTLKQMLKKDIG